MRLRRIAPGDGRLLRDMRLAALADSPNAFASSADVEGQWADDRWEELAVEWSTGHASATFVAESDEGALGLVGAYRNQMEPGTVELVSMWVAPQGRGTGIGAALVDQVLTWARDSGARRVALWVVQGNGPALGRYTRSGFVVTDTPDLPGTAACRGEIRMARPVS